MSPLSKLQPGATGTLRALDCSRSFRRRLMELGLLPGTEVRLVRRVSVGDLVEIECRGCHLSLRLSEAERLFVDPA
ncbi:MAG: ferrous iron transport protein A [Planctomycetes bacterium]|nr:ferrous iron transport protein A [Planctomycetota bacterium]